jgi:hypothetical protein
MLSLKLEKCNLSVRSEPEFYAALAIDYPEPPPG